jgi:hypothetical protein
LLINTVILSGTLRIYSMAKDKNEYHTFHSLLNGDHVFTLDSETLLAEVRQKTQLSLSKSMRVYVIHDASDIRKESSQTLEYIGKVQSLKKTTINGYKTFNSIAIDPLKPSVDLLEHTTYSTGHPDFVTEANVKLLKTDAETPLISAENKKKIENETYHNTHKLFLDTVLKTHNTLKETNKNVILTHIQDREFDGEAYFEYINNLGDEFITRLKLNRLSNEREIVYTPKTNKISKNIKYKPLIDRVFENKSSYDIPLLKLKNKKYFNVKSHIEWEELVIGDNTFYCVKINLLNSANKPIFDTPMLLITNRLIITAEAAKNVYQAYLLRAKIEVVFKFLKQNLGWETFQVRDFQSIKNLLALAFYLAGYFDELQKTIKNHEITVFLAKLGKGKEVISPFFILKGLEVMIHYQQMKELIDNGKISKEEIKQALKHFNYA